jgi:hypothetical protein
MPIYGVVGKKAMNPIPYALLPHLPSHQSPSIPLLPRSSVPAAAVVQPRSRAQVRAEFQAQSPVVMMLDHVAKGGRLPGNVRLQNWVDKREEWVGIGKERKEGLLKRMRAR